MILEKFKMELYSFPALVNWSVNIPKYIIKIG